MAFRHVAMFRFNPGIPDGTIDAISAGLSTLPGQIPEIMQYSHGRNAGLSPGAYDYAVVAEFASPADWMVYRDHPVHQQLIAELIVPYVAERAAVQFDDELP